MSKNEINEEERHEAATEEPTTFGKKEAAVDYLQAACLTANAIRRLRDIGYFEAPASARHHLAHAGGLAEHSVNVADLMLELGAFREPESAYRVGMLHDLVKCKCYRPTATTTFGRAFGWEYVQPPYPGHGVASVMIAHELGISLTPEETAAIAWHMGAFGLGERELKEYHAAIRRFPRAIILTHAADHLASALEDGRGTRQ